MTRTLADFYTIELEDQGEQDSIFELRLNPDHPIYEGHFPDQPVVPGVCMLQMVAELTSEAVGQVLKLQKANQAKFLIPIVPQQYPRIQLTTRYATTDEQTWKVTASIQVGEQVFFKFKGLLAR
jgi:3-hydroxyacyl-[acyl-carrier-protein] dehydratase